MPSWKTTVPISKVLKTQYSVKFRMLMDSDSGKFVATIRGKNLDNCMFFQSESHTIHLREPTWQLNLEKKMPSIFQSRNWCLKNSVIFEGFLVNLVIL